MIAKFEVINKDIEEKSEVNKMLLKYNKDNKEEFKKQCNYFIQFKCSQKSQESYIDDNSKNQIVDHDEKLSITENQKLDDPIKENKDISIIVKLNKNQTINLNLFFNRTVELLKEVLQDKIINDLDLQEKNYINKDPDLSVDKTLDLFSELEMDEFLRVSNSFNELQPLDESYDETSSLEKVLIMLDKESEDLLYSKIRDQNEKLLLFRETKLDNNSSKQACTLKSNFNKKSKDQNRSRYKRAQNNYIAKKCTDPKEIKNLETDNEKVEGFSLEKLYNEGSVWIAIEESELECSLVSNNMR
ncbi:5797_t:CDS:2 [Racocetra fulgida]|uniref:5797_t:CDS:1 n=1 Tax=Racocetra fulgida TaxID=60492 RepID=A0A9N8Z2X1_9GLOM|nr:5797_t:CDS:2 [Racocetra fulgida]